MKSFLILLLSLGLSSTLTAQPLTNPAPKNQVIEDVIALQSMAELYFNADPALVVEELSKPDKDPFFSPAEGRLIWTGAKAPVSWLRFKIPSGITPEWLLVVKPSFSIILDYVEFYVPDGTGAFQRFATGALQKSYPGEPRSRQYVFQLPPEAYKGEYCYIRLSSVTDVSVEFSLETSLGRGARDRKDFLGYGILFGVLAAMILNSLSLYASLKDSAYLLNVLYLISATGWLFYLQGFSKAIFGQNPRADQALLWFWVGSMLAWGSSFSAYFLRLKEGLPGTYRAVLALAALGAVVGIAGLAGWYDVAFSLSHYLGIILPILGTVVALIRLVQGFPSSLYFFLSWLFLGIGGLTFSLMGLKVLPVSFITVNSSAFGIAFQSILLSVALSDRFKRLEMETERLTSMQTHYKEINLTDEVTGLPNKRFLFSELDEMIAKARRTNSHLSLLMVDVDNFKTFQASLAQNEGDEVLVALASVTKACTRESDRVCSLGGDQLVVVLPGIGVDTALKAAERIRTRFAQEAFGTTGNEEHDDAAPSLTVSIGISELLGEDSKESLLGRADKAMFEAKSRGRNRCVAL